jgi:hypothetical protein
MRVIFNDTKKQNHDLVALSHANHPQNSDEVHDNLSGPRPILKKEDGDMILSMSQRFVVGLGSDFGSYSYHINTRGNDLSEFLAINTLPGDLSSLANTALVLSKYVESDVYLNYRFPERATSGLRQNDMAVHYIFVKPPEMPNNQNRFFRYQYLADLDKCLRLSDRKNARTPIIAWMDMSGTTDKLVNNRKEVAESLYVGKEMSDYWPIIPTVDSALIVCVCVTLISP